MSSDMTATLSEVPQITEPQLKKKAPTLAMDLKKFGSDLKQSFNRAFSSQTISEADGKQPKTPKAHDQAKMRRNRSFGRAKSSHIGPTAEDKVKALETHIFHGILAKGEHLEDFYVLGDEIGKGAALDAACYCPNVYAPCGHVHSASPIFKTEALLLFPTKNNSIVVTCATCASQHACGTARC